MRDLGIGFYIALVVDIMHMAQFIMSELTYSETCH